MGDVHVVGGGRQILELLAGEDVDSDQVDLGVTVLASLGGGHVDNLARAALDNDVTVLAQSRALHGVGGRRAGIGRVEGDIVLLFILLVWVVLKRHGLVKGIWLHGAPEKRGAAKMRGWQDQPSGRFGEKLRMVGKG